MHSHRLILDRPAPGVLNMAIDEALLLEAAENDAITLRFYQWNEPTVSLGYFQHYEDRHEHAASRICAVVRRQTGGGAILHDRELTYSLTLPASHPLARDTKKLYAAVHETFIATLSAAITGDRSRWILKRNDQESKTSPAAEPFLCFERRAIGDVILSASSAPSTSSTSEVTQLNWKILGSAQRRHRGAILQHGSLLLHASPAAPELAGLGDLIGQDFEIGSVAAEVSSRFEDHLGMRFEASRLSAELKSKAAHIANTKYGSPSWTKRR